MRSSRSRSFSPLGLVVGRLVGCRNGDELGLREGEAEIGFRVQGVGFTVGFAVVGFAVGCNVGLAVVGLAVGPGDGFNVGLGLGRVVGEDSSVLDAGTSSAELPSTLPPSA